MPTTSSDWWAARLAKQQPAPQQPAPTYQPQYQQPQQQVPQQPDPEQAARNKARHTTKTGICPECGSDNYMAMGNSNASRCFDCGYPVMQSTSGMHATSDGKAAKPARQPSMGSGYNPQVIIGTVE